MSPIIISAKKIKLLKPQKIFVAKQLKKVEKFSPLPTKEMKD